MSEPTEESEPDEDKPKDQDRDRVERRESGDRRSSSMDRRGDGRVADSKPRRQNPDRRKSEN